MVETHTPHKCRDCPRILDDNYGATKDNPCLECLRLESDILKTSNSGLQDQINELRLKDIRLNKRIDWLLARIIKLESSNDK